MNEHLSKWDQEEYVLGQHTPQMIQHVTDCLDCRAEIARLEHGISLFRDSAVAASAQSLANCPERAARPWYRQRWMPVLQWAVAAGLLLLGVLLFHPSHPQPLQHQASVASESTAIADDALLQRVDEEVSVQVPSSMESLTHLVSVGAETGTSQSEAATSGRSQHHVQAN